MSACNIKRQNRGRETKERVQHASLDIIGKEKGGMCVCTLCLGAGPAGHVCGLLPRFMAPLCLNYPYTRAL